MREFPRSAVHARLEHVIKRIDVCNKMILSKRTGRPHDRSCEHGDLHYRRYDWRDVAKARADDGQANPDPALV